MNPEPGTPTPASDLDALREKLRELGYLDAGVNRFVLAPARAGLGTWGLAWRASARIAVLGALLVGLPATVAVALRLPSLVTRVGDAAILTLYFGGVAAVGAGTVSLAAILIAARLARLAAGRPDMASRSDVIARLVGLLAGAVSLVYLTLWWRVVANAAPADSWMATGLALGVSALVALLLGHTTRVVAQAVLAGTQPGADRGRLLNASWGSRTAFVAVAILASATLFALAPPTGPAAEPAPALVVVPGGLRLLVVGVDGFDPRFARELTKSRPLPLLDVALRGPRLEMPREADRDPVAVWVSIATGHPPDRHGAIGLESRRVAGLAGRVPGNAGGVGTLLSATTDLLRLTRPAISSGVERRESTFWELGAAAGLRTIAVNWWTTWPAAPGDGVVLTERATLRLDRGGALEGEIAPPAVYARLQPQWPALARDAQIAARETAASVADPQVRQVVARAAEIDTLQVLLLRSLSPMDTDLAAVYLPGLDIAQRALLPEAGAPSASAVAGSLDGLRLLYEELDRLLSMLHAALPGHILILVTHPGRVRDNAPAVMMVPNIDRSPGSLPVESSPARLEDVGTTLIHLMGLPLSRDLAGRARTELLPHDLVARLPLRFVERYAPRDTASAPARTGDPLDADVRERLRSLGYVQ